MQFKTKIEQLDTEDIVNSEHINWDFFKNSTVLVTGATGLIGAQIVRSILYANEKKDMNIRILAIVRNKQKAKNLFTIPIKSRRWSCFRSVLKFIVQDITIPIKIREKVDFIIHTANGTSSKGFVEQPVETIDSIVVGTKNVLNFAKERKVKSIVYLSSMEVYGQINLDKKTPLKENEYGYIDIIKTRNSYPEGKRLAENMCFAYAKEYNVPVKIARLAQTIGSGVDINDNRVFAQFARSVILREDIVLHTLGETVRSYIYITDCITAIFSMLENGKNGESYNIANSNTTCSIKEMAEMLCNKHTSSKLKVELDGKYYPGKTKYHLDTTKFYLDTTWQAKIDLEEMFDRLIQDFYLRDKDNIEGVKKCIKKKYNFLHFFFYIYNYQDKKIVSICNFKFAFKKTQKYKKIALKTKVNNRKIVLEDKFGMGYSGNLKYIAEEIKRQNLDVELVWVDQINQLQNKTIPPHIKVVPTESAQAIEELSSAKIWIGTQRKNRCINRGLIKKNGQFYIQTWHGSLGIKKVGCDIHPLNTEGWEYYAKQDAQMLDYIISNSNFENNVYRSIFYGQGKNLMFGHPRNDIFFYSNSDKEKIKNKVYEILNIKKDTKIILYVPSYRDSYSTDFLTLNYKQLKSAIEDKFGGEYIVVIRLHPNYLEYADELLKNFDYIVNACNYTDIQELLLASNIAITDYSSCIFDFMLSRKPAFIYASDIIRYNTERGFYYPLEETPFPIATNNNEMLKNIESFDYNTYKNNVENFLKEKGCMEDGHASERVVDLIKNIMVKNAKD